MAKAVLPSREFRVSTDHVRQDYRRKRALELEPSIAGRRQVAAAIAGQAVTHVARDDGFAIFPPGVIDVGAVVAAARQAAAVDLDEFRQRELEQQQRKKANKAFMTALVDMASLSLESPFLQLALRPEIVASAAGYLGCVPILQYLNVWHSRHVDDEPIKSQLYHCDSDETEQLKVFVLCEAVTPESGPLTWVPASQSQAIRDRLQYMYDSKLTDQQVHDALGARPREIELTGPSGTVAFLDTSRCLHFGSRFRDKSAHRLVVMFQYVTPLAFIFPDNFLEGAAFRSLANQSQDELTRMVLGGQ